jgi:hypothetical protein
MYQNIATVATYVHQNQQVNHPKYIQQPTEQLWKLVTEYFLSGQVTYTLDI